MSERFVIRTGSGLYRDKETLHHPEGKPHHRPVFMVWDTKLGRGGKETGPLCFEETKESAEQKCKRLNDQEDFDDRT